MDTNNPLTALLGVWIGDKGTDIAPEPDGEENNPYYETLQFSRVDDEISNAESQELLALHYHQIVRRKRDNEVFHDETGYWIWDAAQQTIMQSLAIPRGVSLIAGGRVSVDAQGRTVFEVSAAENSPDWQIIQAPFMRDNARTTAFTHQIILSADTLIYNETTTVDIYGKIFAHTDENVLTRQTTYHL